MDEPSAAPAASPEPLIRSTREHVRGRSWPARLLGALSSLKFAASLIAVWGIVISLATVYEGRFGADVVRTHVYEAPWYGALFVLLAINIFGAAAVRFPWKWHQTGFVIVHASLLILIAGFWLNIGRLDGQFLVGSTAAERLIELPVDQLTVRDGERSRSVRFDTLQLAGYPSFAEFVAAPLLPGVQVADPGVHRPSAPISLVPPERSLWQRLRGAARDDPPADFPRVSIIGICDTGAERLGYVSDPGGKQPMVRVRVAVRPPMLPKDSFIPAADGWLDTQGGPDASSLDAGRPGSPPMEIHLARTASREAVAELLNAPTRERLGAGVIAVCWRGKRHDVPIAPEARGKEVALADDLAVVVEQVFERPSMRAGGPVENPQAPIDPLAIVRIGTGPAAERAWGTIGLFARYAMSDARGSFGLGTDAGRPQLVFHHPEIWYPTDAAAQGLAVQLVVGPDRALGLRWMSRGKGLVGTATAPADAAGDARWSGLLAGIGAGMMDVRIEATSLAAAVEGPEARRMQPDKKDRATRWLHVAVTKGSASGKKWIPRDRRSRVPLDNGQEIVIEYARARYDIEEKHAFSVQLEQFYEGKDPAGGSASFASDVLVRDAAGAVRRARVTMNEPLRVQTPEDRIDAQIASDGNGQPSSWIRQRLARLLHLTLDHHVTLYQSSFIPEEDEQGRPIPGRYRYSVFTAATEPGAYWIYLGAVLLPLGMIVMFVSYPLAAARARRRREAQAHQEGIP